MGSIHNLYCFITTSLQIFPQRKSRKILKWITREVCRANSYQTQPGVGQNRLPGFDPILAQPHNLTYLLGCLLSGHELRKHKQRAHDAIITSFWCKNDVATSFWRPNDVIFASCVGWDYGPTKTEPLNSHAVDAINKVTGLTSTRTQFVNYHDDNNWHLP